jgi:hypothetical protein
MEMTYNITPAYNRYTRAYPHLHSFGPALSGIVFDYPLGSYDEAAVIRNARMRFCQAALRLAAPAGVSPQMVWEMTAVAENCEPAR